MARLARVIAVGIPHHITQRGNARQYILSEDADRIVCLDLLKRYCQLYELALVGYCLMSNHVHLVAIPGRADMLARALKQTHGRYATYWNVTHGSSGHVWQGRFYSCPLDAGHLWMALRYCERNPVRARMVGAPQDWKWSSAAAHCGAESSGMPLEMERWEKRWTATTWREYLAAPETDAELAELRQCTHTGRPLGSREFIAEIERSTQRHLLAKPGGRPEKRAVSRDQQGFPFKD